MKRKMYFAYFLAAAGVAAGFYMLRVIGQLPMPLKGIPEMGLGVSIALGLRLIVPQIVAWLQSR